MQINRFCWTVGFKLSHINIYGLLAGMLDSVQCYAQVVLTNGMRTQLQAEGGQ